MSARPPSRPGVRLTVPDRLPVIVAEDRILVLPVDTDVPLVLLGTAVDCWHAVRDRTIEEAVDALAEKYGASEEELRQGVEAFVANLTASGVLIQR
jgi:hypothetical protein